jgi:uncharacterized protein
MPSLRSEFGVSRLWIVGSRARGDHRADSDLDLMVRFERRGISLLGFCRLEQKLTDSLGLTVDLVEEGAMSPRVAETLASDAVQV